MRDVENAKGKIKLELQLFLNHIGDVIDDDSTSISRDDLHELWEWLNDILGWFEE